MSKKIVVSLDPQSIKKAVNDINKYQEDVDKKIKLLLTRLGHLGVDVAKSNFGSAVTVTVDIRDDGFVINANGDAVCFLEFGAGTKAGLGVPLSEYKELPIEVRPGSWSEEHAREFVNTGYKYWTFGGKKIEFIEPRMGMYKASRKIQEEVVNIAKEVFGND